MPTAEIAEDVFPNAGRITAAYPLSLLNLAGCSSIHAQLDIAADGPQQPGQTPGGGARPGGAAPLATRPE
jgi:hypothetical protein